MKGRVKTEPGSLRNFDRSRPKFEITLCSLHLTESSPVFSWLRSPQLGIAAAASALGRCGGTTAALMGPVSSDFFLLLRRVSGGC